MADKDILEKAAQATGHTKTIGFCRDGNPKHSPIYWMQWSGQAAEDLMRRVLPFMGERRSAKIRECLAQNLSHHARQEEAA